VTMQPVAGIFESLSDESVILFIRIAAENSNSVELIKMTLTPQAILFKTG
jgi:hypothetical protein